ncbi:MAG: methyltransferase RsmF C-terminal domain-like protein, partial [Bacteroidales bacterium]
EWIRNEFDAIPVSVPTQESWGIKGALKYDNPVYRFMPHATRGEGFFLAVLQKPETAEANEPVLHGGRSKKKDKKGGGKNQPLPLPAVAKTWLANSTDYEYEVKGASVFAFPAEHKEVLNYLFTGLKIVSAGILVGEIKGKDLIPAQSLALSTALDAEAFNTCEVTREQAIAYLKKEALVLDADLPKGYLLLTYKQIPIGFVKQLGNRANNLYPQEWRIRTTYLPEEIITLDSI